MTVAELKELEAAGWDISNHSKTHPTMTTLSVPELVTRSARHMPPCGVIASGAPIISPTQSERPTIR
jgi:hypothetical protein